MTFLSHTTQELDSSNSSTHLDLQTHTHTHACIHTFCSCLCACTCTRIYTHTHTCLSVQFLLLYSSEASFRTGTYSSDNTDWFVVSLTWWICSMRFDMTFSVLYFPVMYKVWWMTLHVSFKPKLIERDMYFLESSDADFKGAWRQKCTHSRPWH